VADRAVSRYCLPRPARIDRASSDWSEPILPPPYIIACFDLAGVVAHIAQGEGKLRVDGYVIGAAAFDRNRHLFAVPLNLRRAAFLDSRPLHHRERLDRVLALFRRHAIGADLQQRSLTVLGA